MTLGDWLREAAQSLRVEGCPHPQHDVLLLAQDVLHEDKALLLAHFERSLTTKEKSVLDELIGRRRAREPLQYVRGVHEFWGHKVRVGPGCLIPRPETEHLVEIALSLMEGVRNPRGAELGTGSGCVLMALCGERPDGYFFGIEKYPAALKWSERNLKGVSNVSLVKGDMASGASLTGLDIVVSNPPYVTTEEWETLPPEVKGFEPETALRCGDEALLPYRRIARWAEEALKPGGKLACEIGVAQARRAAAMRRIHPSMKWLESARDLGGRLRVVVWEKKS